MGATPRQLGDPLLGALGDGRCGSMGNARAWDAGALAAALSGMAGAWCIRAGLARHGGVTRDMAPTTCRQGGAS
eukprot:scaffold1106_cov608-Prasinococcus_capsulatus_cf.AAC.2